MEHNAVDMTKIEETAIFRRQSILSLLIMQLIMEKVKIYLDTNTILNFFINQSRALKTGVIPIIPEKLKFFIANSDKMEFILSPRTQYSNHLWRSKSVQNAFSLTRLIEE
mgnify:CR=1 FL=1